MNMNEKTKEASLLKEKPENTGLKIGLERYALSALIAGILTIVAVLLSFSFSSLDNKIRETKTDLKEDIKEVKMELKEDIKEVRSDLQEVKSDLQEVKSDLQEVKSDLQTVNTKLDQLLSK